MTKIVRVVILTLGLSIATHLSAPVYAQSAPTRERVQAELSRVGQDVWHAKLTSDLNAQMYQAWTTSEAAYYKGDYEKAMKKSGALRSGASALGQQGCDAGAVL